MVVLKRLVFFEHRFRCLTCPWFPICAHRGHFQNVKILPHQSHSVSVCFCPKTHIMWKIQCEIGMFRVFHTTCEICHFCHFMFQLFTTIPTHLLYPCHDGVCLLRVGCWHRDATSNGTVGSAGNGFAWKWVHPQLAVQMEKMMLNHCFDCMEDVRNPGRKGDIQQSHKTISSFGIAIYKEWMQRNVKFRMMLPVCKTAA